MIQIGILAATIVASYFSPWAVATYPFWVVYSILSTPKADESSKLKELESRVQQLELERL